MLDFLNRVHIADEGDYGNMMRTQVEPYLAKRRREDTFMSADGKSLHYEAYEKLLSRGSIIILHGFCESAEKFREVAYCFRKVGYSVFVPDLRGHGKSYRDSEVAERVDIDTFDTYAEELNIFIESIVKPLTPSGKIHIYSHSLGSTVALLYLMRHPRVVEKAVLSSPMICGNMGMPVAVAGTAAKLLCGVGGKRIPAPGRCVFDKDLAAENSDATSRERFEYYLAKRVKEPLYQTSGPSFSWVKASLEARKKLMSADNVGELCEDMIIFIPAEDKQLLTQETCSFAEKADIKLRKVRGSRHEIFMSIDEELRWYLGEILEFFGDED